ncbi:MAG: energy transducer TonB [Hyphomonadaceae bacterium]|nr:energy transducer TonB [Hyphomonadaceae bacterium]MBC6412363.1 energy transducer TonB [Hyphomonadaceae bacterium]
MPRSEYPADPWVKTYAAPDDCPGGEKLAAVDFDLPLYPRRAFNSGRQGWVIVRLDVDSDGQTENVSVERSLPAGLFGSNAKKAVEKWTFEPPRDGPLQNCRVLIRYRLGTVSLGG